MSWRRSTSGVPSSASSCLICCDRVLWVICKRRAASVKVMATLTLPRLFRPTVLRTTVLGLAQILIWGGSFFLLAVLAPAVIRETGWPPQGVYGSLSVSISTGSGSRQRPPPCHTPHRNDAPMAALRSP